MNHGHLDIGFACVGRLLILPIQTPVVAQPGKCSFHNPPLLNHDETFGPFRAQANLDTDGPTVGKERRTEFMIMILVIAEDELQPGDVWCGRSIYHVGSRTPVLDTRGRDEDGEKQAHTVCQDRAFSPLDFLAPVVPSFRAAGRRRGHGLAIDHTQTGRRRTACLNPHLLPQGIEDSVPRPVLLPLLQVLMNRAWRQQIMGKHFPLATGLEAIQDRVNDLAPLHRGLKGTGPTWFPLR